MNEDQKQHEFTGTNTEDAVDKGLKTLGLQRDDVMIDVIDEGSRGIFGLGARDTVVRLTLRSKPTPVTPVQPQAAPETPSAPTPAREAPAPVAIKPTPAVPPTLELAGSSKEEDRGYEEEGEDDDEYGAAESAFPDASAEEMLAVTETTMRELLEHMMVEAEVSVRMGKRDKRQPTVIADIRGEDLSQLIGRRSETLNALQYISRLIVGKKLNRSVSVVVDVEGFRERREQQLRQLARRMAQQAIETGKRQVLEPMPPNERRLIHLELRNHPEVTTESIGDGERRKVTIVKRD